MKAKKRSRVTKAVSLSTDLAQWAEDQAKADNRNLSNFVETVLKKFQADTVAAQKEPAMV